MEADESFSVDRGAAVTARDALALLDFGAGDAAVGGETGRLRRVASFSRELADRWQSAFVQSFWTVSSAEVFDKTLIVAVLCALFYGAQSALQGAVAALAMHLSFAVAFGLMASHIVPLSTLHFVTAGLFGLITIFHIHELTDSSDPRTSQLEDGLEDLTKPTVPHSPAAKHRVPSAAESAGFACCFFPVFLAEWGDRTQVVLIALDATLPVLPVFCGAAVALSLLMVLAVVPAAIFGRVKVSDHALGVISSVGLALCTALAIWSGIKARKSW